MLHLPASHFTKLYKSFYYCNEVQRLQTQTLQALHTAVFSPCLFLTKQFSFAVLRVLSLSKKVPLYLQTSQTAGRLQPTSAPYGQQQPTLPFLSTWAETLLNIHKTASSSVLLIYLLLITFILCIAGTIHTNSVTKWCSFKKATEPHEHQIHKDRIEVLFWFPYFVFILASPSHIWYILSLRCVLRVFISSMNKLWEVSSFHMINTSLPQKIWGLL